MDQAPLWRAKGDETDRNVTRRSRTLRVGSALNFGNSGKRALQGIAAISGSRHPREVTSITDKQWKSRPIRSNDEVKILLPKKPWINS